MFKSRIVKLLPKKKTLRGGSWSCEERQRRRLIVFVKAIQVSGKGISTGVANEINEFNINLDEFDYEHLSFELSRVCGSDVIVTQLNHKVIESDTHIKIAYKLGNPGAYALDIKYKDLSVPLSPFRIEIKEQSLASANDVIAVGRGLHHCMAGEAANFFLNIRDIEGGDILVTPAAGMLGESVPEYIITKYKNGYQVEYVADKSGPFFFRIKFNGKHIPGSPFLINVSDSRKKTVLERIKTIWQMYMDLNSSQLNLKF